MVRDATSSQWKTKLGTDGEDPLSSFTWNWKGGALSLNGLTWLKSYKSQWVILVF